MGTIAFYVAFERFGFWFVTTLLLFLHMQVYSNAPIASDHLTLHVIDVMIVTRHRHS